MRHSIQALFALLLASFVLYAGNGLQTTLLAVRGNLESFPAQQIGFLFAAYSAGFIAGCRWTPVLVMRVGHIRCFTALASIASAAALGHALLVNAEFWMALRVMTGFCMAGLSMVIESWINEKATNQNRGQILSIYRIVDLGAIMCGQALLLLASPLGFTLFALLSILISLSLVPVALTTSIAPRPLQVARMDLRRLWRVAPLAVIGCFGTGAANGAFWGVGPVYVLNSGYDSQLVALFMSVAIFAGVLSQWPLGLLSDRVDRRKVILGVAIACALAGVFLAIMGSRSLLWLLAGAGLFGFLAFSLFGLSAAHAHDYSPAENAVETSAGLLLMFGLGSVVGPMVAPLAMQQLGTPALFMYTATVHVALAFFGFYRIHVRAPAKSEAKDHFVALPESTPVVYALDPRGPDLIEGFDETADMRGDRSASDKPT